MVHKREAFLEVGRWSSFFGCERSGGDFVIASRSKDEDYETLKHIWLAEKHRTQRLLASDR